MRKALLLALATVVVVGAGLLAVSHYKNYQNKKSHDAAVTAQHKADEVASVKAAAAAEYQSLQGKYDTLRIECEKGAAAYAQLTPSVKAKSPQPACGPAVVR